MRPSQPPYRAIAEHYRSKIERGELREGEQLPSARELAAQHGVSLGTAKRVLDTLKEQGLARGEPGWGTFVAPRDEGNA